MNIFNKDYIYIAQLILSFMQDKTKEKNYFNEFTIEQHWNAFSSKTYDKIINLFINLTKPSKEDLIIDMGCGTGEITYKISKNNLNNILGIDISNNCISMAKKNFKNIKFIVGDIENTKLKKGSVDIIFLCGILHHFINYEKVIREINRILKNNGKVFIFEPNAKNPVLWLFRDEKSPFNSNNMRTPNEKFVIKEDIKKNFEKFNFNIIVLDGISNISYSKEYFKRLFSSPLCYLVYPYNFFEWLLNKTYFKHNYGSFIYGYITKK